MSEIELTTQEIHDAKTRITNVLLHTFQGMVPDIRGHILPVHNLAEAVIEAASLLTMLLLVAGDGDYLAQVVQVRRLTEAYRDRTMFRLGHATARLQRCAAPTSVDDPLFY